MNNTEIKKLKSVFKGDKKFLKRFKKIVKQKSPISHSPMGILSINKKGGGDLTTDIQHLPSAPSVPLNGTSIVSLYGHSPNESPNVQNEELFSKSFSQLNSHKQRKQAYSNFVRERQKIHNELLYISQTTVRTQKDDNIQKLYDNIHKEIAKRNKHEVSTNRPRTTERMRETQKTLQQNKQSLRTIFPKIGKANVKSMSKVRVRNAILASRAYRLSNSNSATNRSVKFENSESSVNKNIELLERNNHIKRRIKYLLEDDMEMLSKRDKIAFDYLEQASPYYSPDLKNKHTTLRTTTNLQQTNSSCGSPDSPNSLLERGFNRTCSQTPHDSKFSNYYNNYSPLRHINPSSNRNHTKNKKRIIRTTHTTHTESSQGSNQQTKMEDTKGWRGKQEGKEGKEAKEGKDGELSYNEKIKRINELNTRNLKSSQTNSIFEVKRYSEQSGLRSFNLIGRDIQNRNKYHKSNKLIKFYHPSSKHKPESSSPISPTPQLKKADNEVKECVFKNEGKIFQIPGFLSEKAAFQKYLQAQIANEPSNAYKNSELGRQFQRSINEDRRKYGANCEHNHFVPLMTEWRRGNIHVHKHPIPPNNN